MVNNLVGASGDAPEVNTLSNLSGGTFFDTFTDAPLPAWPDEEDVDFYVAEYERTG